jgi:hypothetical protein
MRTIGNGYMTWALAGGWLILIVSAAMLERPSAAVTRSLTTWGAGVAKVAPAVGPPSSKAPNGPLSAKSHAYLVIRLLRSVEVEVSVTDSPTFGSCGDHTKEANGAPWRL